MSWRGSFITNWIYCDSDFEFLKGYLKERFEIHTIGECVIAGLTRDSGIDDSMNDFDINFRDDIEAMIKLPLIIAVITDGDWGDALHYTPTCPEYQEKVRKMKEAEERRRLAELARKQKLKEEQLAIDKLCVPKEVTEEKYKKTLSESDAELDINFVETLSDMKNG